MILKMPIVLQGTVHRKNVSMSIQGNEKMKAFTYDFNANLAALT